MKRPKSLAAILLMIAALTLHGDDRLDEPLSGLVTMPTTQQEARSRAALLHLLTDGALQVMHRDFFDDENPHTIPSASLEDVFKELSASGNIQMRWLVVDTDVVNIDHRPADEFEQKAIAALAAGKSHFEAVDNGQYRFAGPIRLASQCLKCHVRNRTSTRDRVAGLSLTMPIAATLDSVKSDSSANSGGEESARN